MKFGIRRWPKQISRWSHYGGNGIASSPPPRGFDEKPVLDDKPLHFYVEKFLLYGNQQVRRNIFLLFFLTCSSDHFSSKYLLYVNRYKGYLFQRWGWLGSNTRIVMHLYRGLRRQTIFDDIELLLMNRTLLKGHMPHHLLNTVYVFEPTPSLTKRRWERFASK